MTTAECRPTNWGLARRGDRFPVDEYSERLGLILPHFLIYVIN
jgi:hypothetical protein